MASTQKDLTIISRYGVGQNNERFFETTWILLTDVFINSLKRQSSKNFRLVLIVDISFSKEYETALYNLVGGAFTLSIYRHDPFSSLTLIPDAREILENQGYGYSKRINLLRVDCDDALHFDFVKTFTAELGGFVNKSTRPISLNPIYGAQFWVGKNIAVGIMKYDYSVQVLSDIFDENFKYIYDFSHKELGEVAVKNGGDSILIRRDFPLWLRGIHSSSDTHSPLQNIFCQMPFFVPIRNIYKFIRSNSSNNKWIEIIPEQDILLMFGIRSRDLTVREVSLPRLPESVCGHKLKGMTRLNRKQEILDYVASNYNYLNKKKLMEIKETFYSF